MGTRAWSNARTRIAYWAWALALLAAPSLAQAVTLVGQNVTVTYSDSLGSPIVDTATVVDPGIEVAYGSGNLGSTVDGVLLEGEYIDMGPASFLYHVRGGGPFASGAQLVFSGFSFSPDVLASVGLTLVDVVGLVDTDIVFSQSSVTLPLDNVSVVQQDFGDIRLDLRTSGTPPPNPIPEPGTMSLVGMGLTGLAVLRRSQARHAC